MDNALAFILRPLILLAFFLVVALIGAAIRRAIPEGRAKRFLTQPCNIVPRSEEERRSWFGFFAWVGLSLVIWVPLIWAAIHYHW